MPGYKITVKPFLNKNLPKKSEESATGWLFPLYYQITYQRKNTQIKSFREYYFENLEHVEAQTLELINLEIEALKKTVQWRLRVEKKQFSLSGMKLYFDFCALPVSEVFELYMKRKLQKVIKYAHSEFLPIIKFDGFDVTFLLVYKASQLLIPHLHQMMPKDYKEEVQAFKTWIEYTDKLQILPDKFLVADWLDVSTRKQLMNDFCATIGIKEVVAKKYIAILTRMVDERLNFL